MAEVVLDCILIIHVKRLLQELKWVRQVSHFQNREILLGRLFYYSLDVEFKVHFLDLIQTFHFLTVQL